MENRTITGAIIEVLNLEGKPLSAKDIFSRIVELNFYKFKAINPYHVVLTQLRRHCVGLDFPTAHKEKYFILKKEGTYWLNNERNADKKGVDDIGNPVSELKDYHKKHIKEFKEEILKQLKAIEPSEFEGFSSKLLKVYGFFDLNVTKKSRDGGIDGHGKLKVGISFLNVAFQCKRWYNNKVSRTEIDKFRGATQGDYEQAIFFTTSSFSRDALQATIKKGAIPIILIDGNSIVDLMIEKKFGIEVENLPVYLSALDDILF